VKRCRAVITIDTAYQDVLGITVYFGSDGHASWNANGWDELRAALLTACGFGDT
jgi:hypothetical protein